MEAKKAEEIMIPLDHYPHVHEETALLDAIDMVESWQLDVEGRKSLPRILLVFDNNERLVGTVRRRDILRGLEPKFLSSEPMQYRKKLFNVKVDPNLAEMSYEKVLDGLAKRADRPVRDVMLPIVATVEHNDHIMKVIYEMVDNNLSLLPILKEGKVIGVVRSVDVLHEVARILHLSKGK